jgi:hypothetical protein
MAQSPSSCLPANSGSSTCFSRSFCTRSRRASCRGQVRETRVDAAGAMLAVLPASLSAFLCCCVPHCLERPTSLSADEISCNSEQHLQARSSVPGDLELPLLHGDPAKLRRRYPRRELAVHLDAFIPRSQLPGRSPLPVITGVAAA